MITGIPETPERGVNEVMTGELTTVMAGVGLIGVTFVVVLISRGVPAVVPVKYEVYTPFPLSMTELKLPLLVPLQGYDSNEKLTVNPPDDIMFP